MSSASPATPPEPREQAAAALLLAELFAERHQTLVGRVMRAADLGRDEAEELVQEAYASALAHAPALVGRTLGEAYGYVAETALGLHRNRARAAARGSVPAPCPPERLERMADDRDRIEALGERDELLAGLAALSPEPRLALVLGGLGYRDREIARLLRVRPARVAHLRHRARGVLCREAPGARARCKRTLEMLAAGLERPLPPRRARECERHLRACERCRRSHERMAAHRELLARLVPAALRSTVSSGLLASTPPSSSWETNAAGADRSSTMSEAHASTVAGPSGAGGARAALAGRPRVRPRVIRGPAAVLGIATVIGAGAGLAHVSRPEPAGPDASVLPSAARERPVRAVHGAITAPGPARPVQKPPRRPIARRSPAREQLARDGAQDVSSPTIRVRTQVPDEPAALPAPARRLPPPPTLTASPRVEFAPGPR